MNQAEMERLARREVLLKLAATGAFGAGGILGLVRDALSAGSQPATPGFRHIKGPVSVGATRASVGLTIKPGQSVVTGAGGEAVYVVGPDAFLQREKTKIAFEESVGAQFLRVITGRVLSVIGKGRDRERNLQVVTPTATIGIRGSGFYIEAEEARTYFCLCYGEAEVIPTGNPELKETIQTGHHERPIYIDASGSPMVAPAKLINHTDDELVMLENLVGRWPPFYGQSGLRY